MWNLVGTIKTTDFVPMTFKLQKYVVGDEKRNPVDFYSRDQRPRSSLGICLWNLLGTTLFISSHGVKCCGQLWRPVMECHALCCLVLWWFLAFSAISKTLNPHEIFTYPWEFQLCSCICLCTFVFVHVLKARPFWLKQLTNTLRIRILSQTSIFYLIRYASVILIVGLHL